LGHENVILRTFEDASAEGWDASEAGAADSDWGAADESDDAGVAAEEQLESSILTRRTATKMSCSFCFMISPSFFLANF
jgi:hypothetical protein